VIFVILLVALCVLAILANDTYKQPVDDGRPHFSVREARVPNWLPEND
jgi:hypothetical protein